MAGAAGVVIVAVVYCLIGGIALTFDIYVLLPAADGLVGALGLLLFNAIVGLIYVAHWNCMRADPGFVPAGWDDQIKPPAGSPDVEAAA